jgi:Restriction endonuclease S subunits
MITRTNDSNSEYPVMMISAGKGFIDQSEKYSRDNAGTSLDKYILLKKGELAYNRGNSKQFPYGAIYEMKEENALIPYVYHCFRIHSESTRYFSYYLNSPFKNDQLSKIITSSVRGNGLLNISKKDFFNISLHVPSVKEQEKVAKFLDLIDERISTQNKIIEGYKSLINGITETVLSNSMGEEISLRTVLSEQKEYSPKNNDYPHVTLSKDGIYEKGERYDRDFLVKNEEKEYKISHYNDICYNPANLKFGVITINKFGDCIFSPIYVTFKINKKYSPDFIALCICRNNFINRARKFEQGTVYERMSVSPDDLLSMTIKLPSLEMQNTIVNNVTSIKNKIMIEEKFLKALNDEKRYLLNNLFI